MPGDELREAMAAVRARTLGLVAHLSAFELERPVDPILSPLAWDLGHVAAYEDLWLNHRAGGRELLRADLAALYDAFETPRAVRADLEFLRGEELLAYLAGVRERALEAPVGDGLLHELVLRHELQHTETMLQALALAGRLPDGEGLPAPLVDGAPEDLVEMQGGPVEIGAPPEGFAYDNERPRHVVELAPFRIGRLPVTNAAWMRFADDGGYARRELWSPEGWAWREEQGLADHAPARRDPPHAPVVHVSWYEADAFARAHRARLPSEAEWEAAAAAGALEGVGEVWEWTSDAFRAYDGFRPHPYREYSEPFFGDRFRVLRGWSCATHPRVASVHFRNWDLPQRRQIFAGVRLAKEPA